MSTDSLPTALTIAGSDSGGGAGIQADLKTFMDHRVFGMSAIAAVTAQNTIGVHRADLLPVASLQAQMTAVFDDFTVGAVKIGMLGTAAHIEAVAEFLTELGTACPPVVLDPVMVSSTGHRLLQADAETVMIERLLPLAVLTTPNLDEAAVLASAETESTDSGARSAAALLAWAEQAPCAVLLTGGDVVGDHIDDRLVRPDWPVRTWSHPRLGTAAFHGTGCTLSSAIAARLAHGQDLDAAVDGGIGYVQALIRAACELPALGAGSPPLPHGMD